MTEIDRRRFLRLAGAAGLTPLAGGLLAACSSPASSSAPGAGAAGRPIRIGFIALTDCASIVMASELGYFAERGLDVEVVKQASWPVTRDNLLSGEIDAAHCLCSMPASLAAGVGGQPGQLLQIAMVLSNNGQAITLSSALEGAGYADLDAARAALRARDGATLAMTFPGGTHDTWLRYWLLAAGVGMNDVKIIPIPPPQMVANMKVGTMDGFCVGEPWNAQAVTEGIGYTAIATQDVWRHHPEKALVVNPGFAQARRDELKQVMGAILQASRWLDDAANRAAAAAVGVPAYVGAAPALIEGRMLGRYDLGAGLGTKTFEADAMRFFRGGEVNLPRRSHLMWFLAQYRRFGLVADDPPYREIADRLILADLYEEVAAAESVDVPGDDMEPFAVELDGAEFDPRDPAAEARRP